MLAFLTIREKRSNNDFVKFKSFINVSFTKLSLKLPNFTSPKEVTDAERGAPSIIAISPKHCPFFNNSSDTTFPSSANWVIKRVPSKMMYKFFEQI